MSPHLQALQHETETLQSLERKYEILEKAKKIKKTPDGVDKLKRHISDLKDRHNHLVAEENKLLREAQEASEKKQKSRRLLADMNRVANNCLLSDSEIRKSQKSLHAEIEDAKLKYLKQLKNITSDPEMPVKMQEEVHRLLMSSK